MKIFFTLLSFIVSILLLGNSTYTTTVAEQNDIEKQEVVFSSEKRITSDYLEGSGGVNFWCETIDGEIYLKLEYIPQDEQFESVSYTHLTLPTKLEV